MLELMKMSKMNPESFDTFVSSKGFVFIGDVNDTNYEGVQYAIDYNPDDKKALKFVTLFSRHYNHRFGLNYQTLSNTEYVNLKNQIKGLGFKYLYSESYSIDEMPHKSFTYGSGKSLLTFITSLNKYQITYTEGLKFDQ